MAQESDAVLKAIRAPVVEDLERVQGEIRGIFDAPSRMLSELSTHLMSMPGKKFRPTLLLLVTGMGARQSPIAIRSAAVRAARSATSDSR